MKHSIAVFMYLPEISNALHLTLNYLPKPHDFRTAKPFKKHLAVPAPPRNNPQTFLNLKKL